VALLPFIAFAAVATLVPRIEIYTVLICGVLKPELFDVRALEYASVGHPRALPRSFRSLLLVGSQYLANHSSPNRCATDPVVQAEVAKLVTGTSANLTVRLGPWLILSEAFFGIFLGLGS
jgi:hypothetical protein